MEHLTETVVEGIAVKAASGSQFGGRIDDTGDDHGDDEIALAGGSGAEDGIELQIAQATEDSGDMAVRKGSGDKERIGQRRGGSGQRACQGEAECLHLMRRKMGNVGNGASLDLAVFTIGFTKENGGRRVAIGYGGNVHAYIIRQ